ncbi:MAG TPA: ABC transporter ATP-binding protein [Bacteroidetes bacterium]|nr:ABC transporter ATP-binding protein [Candidatus Limimorpha avicola]
MKQLLQVNNLRIKFCHDNEWTEAVHGINFDVFRGKTLGIVGESGSGKSVSCLAVMKLLDEKQCHIDADNISLEGNDISKYNDHEMSEIRGKRIAMIFQEPMTSLNPVLRCGFQVMETILTHEKIDNEKAKQRVIHLFEKVRLPRPATIFNSYPHELSGGQKQRVMIAMALVCNPQILIADEPTTALDVTIQKEILALLRDLQKDNDMGMIFITHDLGVVAEIADYVTVMHNGTIVEHGTISEILQNPKEPYTKGLLACRPTVDIRLRHLPTVKEYLDGIWKDERQVIEKLSISSQERTERLRKIYSQKPLLKIEHLSKWYPIRKGLFNRTTDYVKAVDDVCFDLYPGETLGLVGESGCGKTTLGRTILRLIEPTSGKIIFNNIDVTALNSKELRHFRKQAQIVFQDPYSSLNPFMTIGDAIAEPIMIHRPELDAFKRRDMVFELLEKVGLKDEHYKRYPHEFSGGQRQRICIARALAVNPKMIICDESVSALDVSVQAQVLNLLNELKNNMGFTYIFISHDLSVVRFMSDRILVMYNGKPVELNDADKVFNEPEKEYTKKLISALPGIKDRKTMS